VTCTSCRTIQSLNQSRSMTTWTSRFGGW